MGGRGAWSQPTATGFTSYDYHKVYEEGDTHFIVQHGHETGGPSAPVMSQTTNVTYATLGRDKEVKYISVYRKRKMIYQIDVNNPHKGIKTHIHHCDERGYRIRKEPIKDMILNEDQERLYKRVLDIFDKHKKEIQV